MKEPFYRMIHAETATELETRVEDWLVRGWELVGGPFEYPFPVTKQAILCQAMVLPWLLAQRRQERGAAHVTRSTGAEGSTGRG